MKLWCDVSECNATETSIHFGQSSAPCRPRPTLAGRAVEQSIPGPLPSPAFVCTATFSKQSPVSNIPRGLCCSLNGIRGRQSQHSSLWLMVMSLECPWPGLSPESCPQTLLTGQFLLAFAKPTRSWLGFAWGCRGCQGYGGRGCWGWRGDAQGMWGQCWRDAGGRCSGTGRACGGSTEGWRVREMPGGMQGEEDGEDAGSANAFQGDRGGGGLRLAALGDAGATWGVEPGNARWAG